MRKRIFLAAAAVLLVCALGLFGYVYIYDASKSTFYQPSVHPSQLEAELKRLNPADKTLSSEVSVRRGGLKAIFFISRSTNDPDDTAAYTIREIADRWSYGGYYQFSSQDMEAAVCETKYTPIKEAVLYGWFQYEGNLYAKRYGREQAKGKPNYRYQHEIFIRKVQSSYHILAFCNTGSIDAVLKEGVDQINALR